MGHPSRSKNRVSMETIRERWHVNRSIPRLSVPQPNLDYRCWPDNGCPISHFSFREHVLFVYGVFGGVILLFLSNCLRRFSLHMVLLIVYNSYKAMIAKKSRPLPPRCRCIDIHPISC